MKNESGKYIGTNARGLRVGEYHPHAKLSDEAVDSIREMREDKGMSYGEISKALNIPKSTVRCYCKYYRRAQLYERWKAAGTNNTPRPLLAPKEA